MHKPSLVAFATLFVACVLGGCSGPEMRVDRAFGRGLFIENTGDEPFKITRVIGNGSREDPNCNNYPNTTLSPGETHSIVFLLCGSIDRIDVETDRGTSSFVVQ